EGPPPPPPPPIKRLIAQTVLSEGVDLLLIMEVVPSAAIGIITAIQNELGPGWIGFESIASGKKIQDLPQDIGIKGGGSPIVNCFPGLIEAQVYNNDIDAFKACYSINGGSTITEATTWTKVSTPLTTAQIQAGVKALKEAGVISKKTDQECYV